MLESEKLTFTNSIKNNDYFKVVISKLTLDLELSETEKSYILSCALLFLNEYNLNRNYKSFAEFSYYIILKYSIKYNDYKPLFDFSVEFGFFPIANSIIKNNLLFSNKLNDFIVKYKLKEFEKNNKENVFIETLEQNIECNHFINDLSNEKGFLAPTSYGKSSIIIDYIKSLKGKQKIAIIVPTKSLLMQTYKLVRDAKLDYRLLIHNEMYKKDISFIGIFTQERALRLIKENKIIYDSLIIDEAHNILGIDNRNILLGRLIKIAKTRNSNTKVVYLSPLVNDINNLKISKSQEINKHIINFNIKSPELFEYKIDNTLLKHNRFFINKSNTGLFINKYKDYFELILKTSQSKNFIYNYRPKDIEDLAIKLVEHTQKTGSPKIDKIIEILRNEVHENFYLIDLLKYGIIYLHGKLPDLIKEYLESKFVELEEIKYVIANSVILEGMNLPIDNLYIFNTRGLNGKELTNLIGRVNRLNEIFKEGNNLNKLLPKIYFVNNELYNKEGDKPGKMFNKIMLLRNRTFSDEIKNPLLERFDINSIKDSDKIEQEKKREKILQIIKNEEFLIESHFSSSEKLKQYFIENSFGLFYNDLDYLVDKTLQLLESKKYLTHDWDTISIIDKIELIFIRNYLSKDKFITDFEFYRLKEETARKYYNMLILNRKKSLKENIQTLFRYLKRRRESENINDNLYYIGTSYGEEKYKTDKYFSELYNSKVAINLKTKTDKELINYAVIKLKIEDDFISFKLNKFIVFLYDYELISEDEYNEYVYGTSDKNKIDFSKFGINIGLIDKLEKDHQLKNLNFDKNYNLIANKKFKEYLNTLNDFQRFEIERFII